MRRRAGLWARTRLGFVSLLTCLVGAAPAGAAPVDLDDQHLSKVTASVGAVGTGGSIDAPGVSSPPRPEGEVAAGQTGVIAEGSTATSEERNEVRLEGGSQARARAGSISNASGSDVASGSNLADTTPGEATALHLDQQNRVEQTAIRDAGLGHFAALAPFSEHRVEQVDSLSRSATHQLELEKVDLVTSFQGTRSEIHATVAPERFSFFPDDDPSTPADERVRLGGVSFGFPDLNLNLDLDPTDDAGGLLDSIGITLLAPSLSVGDVLLVGNDVILEAPRLMLPGASLTLCLHIAGCTDTNGNTPRTITVGGRTIVLPTITLQNLNPLGGLDLQLGYAVLGDGTLVIDGGGLGAVGTIQLDPNFVLENLGELALTNVPDILKNLAVALPDLELPSFEVDVDFDVTLPVIEVTAPGVGGENPCTSSITAECQASTTTTKVDTAVHTTTRTEQSSESSAEGHFAMTKDVELGEVTLEGARADYTVVRGSSLESERYDIVRIDGSSQSEVRALHAVNVARAIVGNGVNVGRQAGPGSNAGASLNDVSQANSFSQIGGL